MSSAVALPNPAASRPLDWRIIVLIGGIHFLAIVGVGYSGFVRFSWATAGLAAAVFFAGHFSISMGMHRLYAHAAYEASRALELVLLMFSAMVCQGPAWWWAFTHICHHAETDTKNDPYTVLHGFWWAHMWWVFRQDAHTEHEVIRWRLLRNPLLRFQGKYYFAIAPLMGLGLPTAIASMWGDPWGGLLVGGFLRLAVQYHLTWVINSVAHTYGTRRYTHAGTACTNWWLGILTVGESYHERHHLAEQDYRLGTRWYDLDPSKWLIWACAKLGLARNLKRFSEEEVFRNARFLENKHTLQAA